jgi:short-subunit dehydrogenase
MKISGTTFLITGASSGIGAATARAVARKGGRVILVARSEPRLRAVTEEITADAGAARYYAVNLSDPAATEKTLERVRTENGVPDVVMNNAGAGRWKHLVDTTPAEALEMMAVPYLAAFAVTRSFLPAMLERRSGLVVNVTSVASYMAWPGAAGYTAARWAMRGFHDALTAEVAGTGVKTMLVVFAKVQSEYWQHNPGSEENVPAAQSMIPVLTSEQAADFIVTGIENDDREVIAPRRLRILLSFARFFPGLVQKRASKQ